MQQQLNASRILESLVFESFVYSTASRLGFRSSPENIRQVIKEFPAFQVDGKFDPVHYRNVLKANGTRPARVEADFAKSIVQEKFFNSFALGLQTVSDAELEDQKWLATQRIYETFELANDKIPAPKKPTSAQLEEFTADAGTQARLQEYYNRNISQFRQEEEVKARHILLNDKSEISAEDLIAQIKAEEISFEDAAKKYSEDKSNASRGGDLGFFKRGVMVPEFEQMAFSMSQPGELSAPVETQFGTHIIRFEERKDAQEKALETVREEILPDVWMEAQKAKKLDELVTKWSESKKGPSARELKKYELEWTEAQPWTPAQDFFAPIGSVQTHMQDLLSLSEGSPFLGKAIPKGRNYVFVRLVSTKSPEDFNAQQAQEAKASKAYDYFVRSIYEEAKKNERIYIKEETVEQIQAAIQQQSR